MVIYYFNMDYGLEHFSSPDRCSAAAAHRQVRKSLGKLIVVIIMGLH